MVQGILISLSWPRSGIHVPSYNVFIIELKNVNAAMFLRCIEEIFIHDLGN